ncbi:diacylglycerol/lipid kinase family protein [Flaviaesturariibacter aridisoli]|uniref:Diacylglycerol kinase family lipid kinase n=1 Tax=Flaviaesturariibacter aridisoli TaxID=2545761 RepID=A0A4R4E228_9BACT|nr:diacylglycerol kinase family protein [Flaviaesturariibacter aridisoli]TCZ72907.1 diacylglycerol kinase family lipid kinase [Flaviaesturariibacter aridisoli]
MQKEGQLRVLFVINPVSGGKAKTDWETQIRNTIRDSIHEMEFFLLTGEDDESSVRHHIERVQPDRVVAVGGDGTVKLVAGLLLDRNIPLGILPAGSANGMAREFGLPLDVESALKVVLGGIPTPIDLLSVNDGDICIHLSDLGLNAMLVKYFEGSKKRGMWGYGRAVLRVLWQKQKIHASIETDKESVRRGAYMIVLANARKYGTGANINPDGDPSDGYFEVVIVRRLNLVEILKALFTNRSFDASKIEVLKARQVTIQTSKRTYFQVDGEYRGKTGRVVAHILPAAVKVLLPAKDRES